METIFDLLQAYNLNILEVIIAIIPIFFIAYRLGIRKIRKLTEDMHSLQRQILDLNEELLLGKSETPVIGIKHEPLKITNIAK